MYINKVKTSHILEDICKTCNRVPTFLLTLPAKHSKDLELNHKDLPATTERKTHCMQKSCFRKCQFST